MNYWQGKDSLKKMSSLAVDGQQKPGPQQEKNEIGINEFLLVMMRLGLGFLERDLTDRFCRCVSRRTVSRTLITRSSVLI